MSMKAVLSYNYLRILSMADRNSLILLYFKLDLTYAEIVITLRVRHNITICERQCRRILKMLDLTRRRYSCLSDAVTCIREQLQGSGELLGYRAMREKCKEIATM